MKRYNTIYYLLFILLVTGAFASMAQNSYGLKIMGGVAFAFGLIFLVELISVFVQKESKNAFIWMELACLSALSFIFALRVFNLRFAFIEECFAAGGSLLVLLYLRKMLLRFREFRSQNNFLSVLSLVFHLSMILFLISLVMFPFKPKIAEIAGSSAFVLLLIFIIAGLLKKKVLVEGEKVTAFTMIKEFKDHSIIVISLFIIFSLYVGLHSVGVLPGIYSDEYPQAYYDLVNKAASGKDKPVAGKDKYEIFKEKYDQFLKHNNVRK